MSAPLRPKVAHFFGSYRNFTGSQRSTHLFLRHFGRDRYEPCVIVPGEGECLDRFRELGLTLTVASAPPPLDQFNRALLRLPLHRKVSVAARVLAPYWVRLARLLTQLRVTILHTADLRGQLLAAPAARLAGLPVVAHFRGEFGGIHNGYVATGAALADRMVLVSPNVWKVIPTRYHRRCMEIADPILVPAVEPRPPRNEVLESLVEPLQLGDTDLLLVSVGTLVPQKGAHRLLEALRLIAPAMKTTSPPRRLGVVLAGKTPDEAYRLFVDQLARSWGLADVRITGWVPDQLVEQLYRVADLACFPGVQSEELEIEGERRAVRCLDALPRGVTEPMSYGVAVVATAVAGIERAIADGRTGILVRPSDPRALGDAILLLVQDSSLRDRLGRAGAASIVDTCSMSSNVERITGLYDELLGLAAQRDPRSRLHRARMLVDWACR